MRARGGPGRVTATRWVTPLLLLGAAAAACGSAATGPRPGVPARRAPTAAPPATPAATVDADQAPPGLQPEAMYSGRPPDLRPSDRLRTLVVTGDVIPVRGTNHALLRLGDWSYPFAATSSLLHSGDLTYVDLEAPLISDCPDLTSGFTFCGSTMIAGGLVAAGVGVANVANNHIGNFGSAGLSQTQALLEARGIAVAGLGRIAVRNIRGVRFGFVGMNLVGTRLDPGELRRQVALARAEADVVIVQFHWGREYETFPFPAPGIAPDDPRAAGRLAIDDGADLVIGNHPHCVQGAELYRGRLITYAHGNFLFDQDWSVGTQEGVVGRYVFDGTRLVAAQYVPVRIVERVQPRPLDPGAGEGREILDRMLRSAHELLGRSQPLLDGNGRNDACP